MPAIASRTSPPPWLSIVLCTYQGARFLGETLDSLVAQDMDGVEIIAVDDGSTDATPELLDRYAMRLPLRMVSVTHAGNWVANTNLGLREARGSYCCLLHQDDLWLPERREIVQAVIAEHPGIGVVAGPSRFIDATGRTVGHWHPPLPTGRALPSAFVLERLLVQNFFALPAPVFKRALAYDVGLLDESLWFLADWKFWGDLTRAGGLVCYPEPRTAFRLHAASQTSTRTHDPDDLRNQYESVMACIRGHLPDNSHTRRAACAARLNMHVSMALALGSHGAFREACQSFARGLCVNPCAWPRFVRDSRISERLGARLRVARALGRGRCRR
jgi:hypothetical protein